MWSHSFWSNGTDSTLGLDPSSWSFSWTLFQICSSLEVQLLLFGFQEITSWRANTNQDSRSISLESKTPMDFKMFPRGPDPQHAPVNMFFNVDPKSTCSIQNWSLSIFCLQLSGRFKQSWRKIIPNTWGLSLQEILWSSKSSNGFRFHG